MTRARRLLYLTNTLTRELYGQRNESRPSRFLGEIDPALIHRASRREKPGSVLRPPARGTYVDYSTSQVSEEATRATATTSQSARTSSIRPSAAAWCAGARGAATAPRPGCTSSAAG